MPTARSLYIDLIKKSISGQLHDPRGGPAIISQQQCDALLREANHVFRPYLARLGQTVESFLGASSPAALAAFPEQLCLSLNGMHRDRTPDSMSDQAAIDSLQYCVEQVIADDIAGDLIETGIWKGGLPLLMRAILKAHEVTDRVVWAADSFEGLPQPDPSRHLKDAIWFHLFGPLDGLKISYDYVQQVFRKYDLLDPQVRFLQGWFSDTLPCAPIDKLAVMRLDGDWYESTRLALETLYPRLSAGGFVIIDDYGLPFGCRRAVDDYRQAMEIEEPVQWVNRQVVFWRKAAPAEPAQVRNKAGSAAASLLAA